MVEVAGGAQVHPAHHRSVVAHEELDVIDLLLVVVHRVEADRHLGGEVPAAGGDRHRDGGIEDDPDVCSPGTHHDEVGGEFRAAELVHLHQNTAAGRAEDAGDRPEDPGVLPEFSGCRWRR
ncbi:MAG TPA: hypothetical protein VMV09_03875 [Candidatus Saccharimonadales bacterium]|nr:hypothetical protein [Candidatus Saccharimonadales bacterium]